MSAKESGRWCYSQMTNIRISTHVTIRVGCQAKPWSDMTWGHMSDVNCWIHIRRFATTHMGSDSMWTHLGTHLYINQTCQAKTSEEHSSPTGSCGYDLLLSFSNIFLGGWIEALMASYSCHERMGSSSNKRRMSSRKQLKQGNDRYRWNNSQKERGGGDHMNYCLG